MQAIPKSDNQVFFGLFCTTDVAIGVQDGEYSIIIHAHKEVLCKEKWFANCLRGGTWKESHTGIIILHETADYVLTLIHYVYTRTIEPVHIEKIAGWHCGIEDFDPDYPLPRHWTFYAECLRICIDLWDLADRYCLCNFLELCEFAFEEQLLYTPGIKAAIDVWVSAMQYWYTEHECDDEGISDNFPRFGRVLARIACKYPRFWESESFDKALETWPAFAKDVAFWVRDSRESRMSSREFESAAQFVACLKEQQLGPFTVLARKGKTRRKWRGV